MASENELRIAAVLRKRDRMRRDNADKAKLAEFDRELDELGYKPDAKHEPPKDRHAPKHETAAPKAPAEPKRPVGRPRKAA